MCRDNYRNWCGECGREVRCREDFPCCDDCLAYLRLCAKVTQIAPHGWEDSNASR